MTAEVLQRRCQGSKSLVRIRARAVDGIEKRVQRLDRTGAVKYNIGDGIKYKAVNGTVVATVTTSLPSFPLLLLTRDDSA
jgi:hypothetical protein